MEAEGWHGVAESVAVETSWEARDRQTILLNGRQGVKQAGRHVGRRVMVCWHRETKLGTSRKYTQEAIYLGTYSSGPKLTIMIEMATRWRVREDPG